MFLSNHVVFVEEVTVVIFQGVRSYAVVCGMQYSHGSFHRQQHAD